MSGSSRIQQEPAWLLHHRPFRDSSMILDLLSLNHGRVTLIARGSRSAKSKLRGILRPFLPLQLSWIMRSDLGTLTGAELHAAPMALTGEALLAGFYLNELLLYLLHRHDPQPEIFGMYSETVAALAGQPAISRLLRVFEVELLRNLGYALNLDHDTQFRQPLAPDQCYEYRVDQGPVPVSGRSGPMVFSGRQLHAIRQQDFAKPEVLQHARRLLQEVIAYHLDGRELKSRTVLREMRRHRGKVRSA